MTHKELAKRANITERYALYLLRGGKTPSPRVARTLEKVTGIPRLAWLYPDEYDNPYCMRKINSDVEHIEPANGL